MERGRHRVGNPLVEVIAVFRDAFDGAGLHIDVRRSLDLLDLQLVDKARCAICLKLLARHLRRAHDAVVKRRVGRTRSVATHVPDEDRASARDKVR